MPFDATPTPKPNPHIPDTDQYRMHNFELLASYLATGKTDKPFNMRSYGARRPYNQHLAHSACAFGHLPYAIDTAPRITECWLAYINRTLGYRANMREMYLFLAYHRWAEFADTPLAAADRIAFYVDNTSVVNDLRSFGDALTLAEASCYGYFHASDRVPGKLPVTA